MNGTFRSPAVRKTTAFTPAMMLLIFLLCTAGVGSVGAQVQLISPMDGAIVPQEFKLQWQPYPGAQSYAYWLLHDLGGTLPGNEPNPHLVGTATEITLRATITLDIEWYVIAYSDANGTNEIARSETRTFRTTRNAPTPTPTPAGFDFNQDNQHNSLDLFNFAWAWYMNRSMPEAPENFDAMDLVDNNIIDEDDLLALIHLFRNRHLIQTPVLPAPGLVRPSAHFETSPDLLVNTQNLFEWTAVDGAVDYVFYVMRDGQSISEARWHIFDATATIWSGPGTPPPLQQTLLGRYYWFVQARNAEGQSGAISELRPFHLVQNPGFSPADLNNDGTVNRADLFFFSLYWQRYKVAGGLWNENVDFDKNDYIQPEDLLIFMDFYHQARGRVIDPNRPNAPVVIEPENEAVITRDDILAGRARIIWEPIPGFQPGVTDQARYQIVFNPGQSNIVIKDFILTASYTLTSNDLQDTRIANNSPITYFVRAIGPNGEIGEPSATRTLTIQTN